MKPMVVGLDIGTSKVVAMVAELGDDGQLQMVGIGAQESRGLKRGIVANIESTVLSIKRAIEEAELMADCKINAVTVSMGGNHISSMNSHGIVAIQAGEVSELDLERVIDAARAVALPSGQKILHILPQEYVIDGQEGIQDPLGMAGVRLEVKVHIVTCALNVSQNIVKCVSRCELNVDDIVLNALASSYAVLTDDEKELGVCLVDMGGGTIDVAVFTAGAIRHTAVIPVAGDQVTNDIAMALRTPTVHAEDVKVRYACALAQLTDLSESIKVPSVGDRPARDLSRQALADVVQPRYEELYTLVQAELRRSGYEELIAAGMVLTGGTAQMEGAVELAEEIFHMPVRLAKPHKAQGPSGLLDNPTYSTCVGLLNYALQAGSSIQVELPKRAGIGSSTSQWLGKIKDLVKTNF
ncbi:cell division protein FtsA [Oceanospirillaceae bacterium]|nr:cell division protein FtsA [Oceanospirillaceae bacterium]MDB4536742.1 cell division protein FtsA [Oceanospirillaceae bacterium]MDC1352239.1 cell division protein FtsA [Oceanospirillaceae bacterium]MDC1507139.1 cell division protein FtsA [Oceanospirillaceae bacterium]MDO7574427.1 cell division protein FtsA [Oceanospirillaceae bacterium]